MAQNLTQDIWGVGPVNARKLGALGCESAADVRDLDPRAVRKGLCPLGWCSFGVATTITGLGRIDQAARVGRLTRGSSPIGAMLSRVM